MNNSAFPESELEQRLAAVRRRMKQQGLDGLLVSVPENIYYLTGLDHWGFFACHILVVPADSGMALACRAMERITVENQVSNAEFYGHADTGELSDEILKILEDRGLGSARLGIEKRSLFLTPRIYERILDGSQDADWSDASGLIDELRLVKSPLEQEYTRRAAAAADAGTLAAVDAIRDGVSDYEVAAACHDAMIRAGSEYPGFGPFIRPTSRLGEEHTTWRGDRFHAGDAVFLEIGGAYRKYQAPMGRLVYVGEAPDGADESAELAIAGMQAICDALKPGVHAGEVYQAWKDVADRAGLVDYHRHHCGYLVGIGFPPSWTGGSMVTSLQPGSDRELKAGMAFHAHSWFTNAGIADYFISNTLLLTDAGVENLTPRTPATLILR
ncbi:MAG TPA: Xaa-Pro peptidase family protein [Gammaproteobacteria bacterium]|nr:Xaa-Pro peptidase family protein [Gammaproteobacteria bacterium]